MKKYIAILAVLSFLMFSCSDETLDRTIFIPDEDNRSLPAYTEWGYNSFGAVYERRNFVAANHIVPCKIVYQNGMLNFSLIGVQQSVSGQTALTFSFPLSEVETIADLAVLHEMEINLTQNSTVTLEENNVETTLNVLGGTLHFKRFQLLRVDDKINRIILSGTFEIRFLRNGRPESISNGRFDLGITDRDFINLTNIEF